MATPTCPNPDCRATLAPTKVQLTGVGVLPNGQPLYVVTCRACGISLGVVAERD